MCVCVCELFQQYMCDAVRWSAFQQITQKARNKTLLERLDHNIRNTHPFNGPLSGTTRASWYQKGKTNLDFIEARDSEW